MLHIHRAISHMPIMELENNSESVWVKIFANKSSNYVASWYRQPNGTVEDFQLLRDQLDHIKSQYKGKQLPSVHVLGDFNFREIAWPARLSKSGTMLRQFEGQMLLDIKDAHGLEQIIPFPTRDKNTLDLILTSLRGHFQDIHSPEKLRDHDIVSRFLRIFIPHIKKSRRKVYLYQKGDFEAMRKDALRFAKEKYFNSLSHARAVQENFN